MPGIPRERGDDDDDDVIIIPRERGDDVVRLGFKIYGYIYSYGWDTLRITGRVGVTGRVGWRAYHPLNREPRSCLGNNTLMEERGGTLGKG